MTSSLTNKDEIFNNSKYNWERMKLCCVSEQCPGDDVFSHKVAPILSSALQCFTSEFGMGSGGSTALRSPGH